jgi:GT2 family glycosyltransferase
VSQPAAPVTLCIINYNGAAYLDRTLSAARGSRDPFDEILLVDDASVDEGVALVRDRYPEVRVIARERNGGPGAARNTGWREAAHDLVLFADNDVALEPECSGRLREVLARNPDVLVAMPRVLYAAEPGTIQYDGADCHFLGHMVLRHREKRIAEAGGAEAETRSVVTCCFMVDRSRWRGAEPFDESFIFNLEDHDFGVRARVMGHRLLAVPAATCLHGHGTAGLSFRPGWTQSPTRVYCLIRNRWRIVLQTFSARTLLLIAPCLLVYEAFQLAGVVRKGWLGSWIRAAGWMLGNPGVTLRARRRLQRLRRLPDGEVVTGGPLPFTPGLLAGRAETAARRVLEWVVRWYWRGIERLL